MYINFKSYPIYLSAFASFLLQCFGLSPNTNDAERPHDLDKWTLAVVDDRIDVILQPGRSDHAFGRLELEHADRWRRRWRTSRQLVVVQQRHHQHAVDQLRRVGHFVVGRARRRASEIGHSTGRYDQHALLFVVLVIGCCLESACAHAQQY
jgi:hypothetical protein